MAEKISDFSIIVAEDDANTLKTLQTFLERRFEQVYAAENGAKALELYKQHRPRIVLSDIRMPEMSGLDLAKRIKVLPSPSYIILLTAMEDPESLKKAMDIGIEKYLSKPIDLKKLASVLDEVMRSIRNEDSAFLANKQLREYTRAVEQSAIVSKGDLKGNITYVNDYFCDISGYSREELIGQPHSIVRHPDSLSSVFKEMWNTIQAKKIWRGRIKNRRKDGAHYIVETTITPILDEHGDIKEYFSLRKDVTQFVEMGRKIRQQEQEKLEREREHLAELNNIKNQLLGVLTHELKTPLNGIINLSEFVIGRLEQSVLEEKNQLIEYLGEVHQNGQFMLEQVSNILELSKIKMDTVEFLEENLCLKMLLDDMRDQFDTELINHRTQCQVVAEPLNVVTDGRRLRQVLGNIFSNAIRYGKEKVKVSLTHDAERFTVVIEDDGPGIENPDALFELFEQQDTSLLTRTSKGIGVGLSLVNELALRMKLKVSVDRSSDLGGARFQVSGRLTPAASARDVG